ncbi:hypothetical protein GCM10027448_04260 [Nocardioides dilutus]
MGAQDGSNAVRTTSTTTHCGDRAGISRATRLCPADPGQEPGSKAMARMGSVDDMIPPQGTR